MKKLFITGLLVVLFSASINAQNYTAAAGLGLDLFYNILSKSTKCPNFINNR